MVVREQDRIGIDEEGANGKGELAQTPVMVSTFSDMVDYHTGSMFGADGQGPMQPKFRLGRLSKRLYELADSRAAEYAESRWEAREDSLGVGGEVGGEVSKYSSSFLEGQVLFELAKVTSWLETHPRKVAMLLIGSLALALTLSSSTSYVEATSFTKSTSGNPNADESVLIYQVGVPFKDIWFKGEGDSPRQRDIVSCRVAVFTDETDDAGLAVVEEYDGLCAQVIFSLTENSEEDTVSCGDQVYPNGTVYPSGRPCGAPGEPFQWDY